MFGIKQASVVQLFQDSIPLPIMHDAGGGVTYIGYCKKLGTPTDKPEWLIIRVTEAGGVTTPEYEAGNAKFEGVWDTRTAPTTKYAR